MMVCYSSAFVFVVVLWVHIVEGLAIDNTHVSPSSLEKFAEQELVSTCQPANCHSTSLLDSKLTPEITPVQSKTTTFSLWNETTTHTAPLPTTSNTAITTDQSCDYWLEHISHRGISAFIRDSSSYKVFRNVKDFGAKGDGFTDDTVAINAAISTVSIGDRCPPGACNSSTLTPALVYFPAGTYLISAPIIDYYYTQLIGNPNCRPKLSATSNFTGDWMIDGNQYQANKTRGYRPTDLFWRQIRNFVLDTTAVAANRTFRAIHWPAAQASSLQNIKFELQYDGWAGHEGLYIEEGSGGLLVDLEFSYGHICANLGNQQFTARNLTFFNCNIGIRQAWSWSWTYQNIKMSSCRIGFDLGTENNGFHAVGSATIIDSQFRHCITAINTTTTTASLPGSLWSPSLALENIVLDDTLTVINRSHVVGLRGSQLYNQITAWAEGPFYSPAGRCLVSGAVESHPRPASLVVQTPLEPDGNGNRSMSNYYTRSKPQYEDLPLSSFVSVRSYGAKGDGATDDTNALQNALWYAKAGNKVLFVDAGTYRVTKTIFIPSGSRIVGEAYPVILASGYAYFADMNNPRVVVQVGRPGDTGTVEWSDMIISTAGPQPGAILIQWNLANAATDPAGMWDVHTRIGGFLGSGLQIYECPITPEIEATADGINSGCIAAFASLHISPAASGLYMENNWFWVADHDLEDPSLGQISIYAGRGMLVESTEGNIWMWASAVEHHTLYQYQLINTKNIVMGQIQTESAYYQPNPPAPAPFTINDKWSDPVFGDGQSGWGLRVANSEDVFIYSAGLYSFFRNNNLTCSQQGKDAVCQARTLDTENTTRFGIYNLNTIGTTNLWTNNEVDEAVYSDNLNGFVATAAMIRV